MGEFYAMYDATKKGYMVAKTTETDLIGYDFVMDDGINLYRVEVKTADKIRTSRSNGRLVVESQQFDLTTRSNKGYTNSYDHIHWFALFCPRLDKIGWIKKMDVESGRIIYKKTKCTIPKEDFKNMQLPDNPFLEDSFKSKYIKEESLQEELF